MPNRWFAVLILYKLNIQNSICTKLTVSDGGAIRA